MWVHQRHTSCDKSFQAFPQTFHTASDKSWVWRPGNDPTLLIQDTVNNSSLPVSYQYQQTPRYCLQSTILASQSHTSINAHRGIAYSQQFQPPSLIPVLMHTEVLLTENVLLPVSAYHNVAIFVTQQPAVNVPSRSCAKSPLLLLLQV